MTVEIFQIGKIRPIANDIKIDNGGAKSGLIKGAKGVVVVNNVRNKIGTNYYRCKRRIHRSLGLLRRGKIGGNFTLNPSITYSLLGWMTEAEKNSNLGTICKMLT